MPGSGAVTFTGPGFGDAHGITVTPNLTGVTTTSQLVDAYNAAIQAAIANGSSQYVNAFKAANITASIHTDSAGKQQLEFTSSNSAFQVTAADAKANGLLGFFAVAGAPAASGTRGNLISSGASELGTNACSGAASNTEGDITYTAVQTGNGSVTINAYDSSGTAHALTIGVSAAQGASMATLLAQLNGSLQASNDSTLQQITAVQNGATAVNFISSLKNFSVQVSPSTTNGLASTAATQAMQVGNGGIADISTMSGAQAALTAITSAVQSPRRRPSQRWERRKRSELRHQPGAVSDHQLLGRPSTESAMRMWQRKRPTSARPRSCSNPRSLPWPRPIPLLRQYWLS